MIEYISESLLKMEREQEENRMGSADVQDLKELLKGKGYKFTGQRSAVLEVLVKYSGKHLSTDEIYTYVRESNPDVGIATVYRTLTLMEKLKLVEKLDLDDGFSRYELARQNEDHRHHHLICSRCGNVSEVEEDLLDSLEEQILKKNDFLVTDHRVKFYGLCSKCRNA
jgi:Fur family ferric uptake transcriptional regulator